MTNPDVEMVRDLKRFVGFAMCHGYKCRLPHCESCYGEDAAPLEPALEALDAALDRISSRLAELEAEKDALAETVAENVAALEAWKNSAEVSQAALHERDAELIRMRREATTWDDTELRTDNARLRRIEEAAVWVIDPNSSPFETQQEAIHNLEATLRAAPEGSEFERAKPNTDTFAHARLEGSE